MRNRYIYNGMGYWTFMDFPDSYNRNYINKWGTFKWSGEDDFSTRAHYYSYGLLTKFFRGPAAVFRVNSNDQFLRVSALQNRENGTYSIVVVSRKSENVPISIKIHGKPVDADFRKYVYDPSNVPSNPFGDLQEPVGKVATKGGILMDTINAGTLNVYTTAYDEESPASVKGLKTEKNPEGMNHIRWQANTEPDFCYYRI